LVLTIEAAGRPEAVALGPGDEDGAVVAGEFVGTLAAALETEIGALAAMPVFRGTGVVDLLGTGAEEVVTGHTPLGEGGVVPSL
jgi:hypothetical protein